MTDEPPDWREAVEAFHEGRPGHAIEPDWPDLEHLHALLLEYKPPRVLEYGSGCSSALLRWWCAQSGASGMSLESDPYWYSANAEALAQGRWARYRLVFSPILAHGSLSLRYAYHPAVMPELVYVDGPFCALDGEWAADVLDIRPWPRVVVVDGRVKQCAMMAHVMSQTYDIDADQEAFRVTFKLKETAVAEREPE